MSKDILMRRHGYTLRPADAMAEDDMLTLPEGPIMVSVRKPRSISHHRLYFGCLGSMIKAGAPGGDVDGLHNVTKLRTGLVKFCTMPNGDYVAFPDSTAFDAMDQADFNKWFPKAVDYWTTSGLIRWLSPDLRAKLETDDSKGQAA